MDLSKITATINAKISLTKSLKISGVDFVIKVPIFEHQAILDELSNAMETAPESGQGEELARRVVAYSLVSVDADLVGNDLSAIMEEMRKWPAFLLNTLGAAAVNFRLEMAAKAAMETSFEWFDIKDFKLKKDEAEAVAEAKKYTEEKAAEAAREAATSGVDPTEEDSSFGGAASNG